MARMDGDLTLQSSHPSKNCKTGAHFTFVVTAGEIGFYDVSLLPLLQDGNSLHIVAPAPAEVERRAEDAFPSLQDWTVRP